MSKDRNREGGMPSGLEGAPWSNPYGSGLTYPSVDAIVPVKAEEGGIKTLGIGHF